jgi:group I intron endonuclease
MKTPPYADTRLKSGVYCITNTVTGHKYIGSTINLMVRIRHHIRMLMLGTHANSYIQNHWNKYGETTFTVTVIEYCDRTALIDREAYYMGYWKTLTRKHGYNLKVPGMHGYAPSTRLGIPLSDEQRKKISETLTGRTIPKEVTDRARATRKLRGYPPPNTGKTLSPEWRKHLSESKKGKSKPEGFGVKVSESLKGVKKSKEHCQNISKAKTGKPSHNKGVKMSVEQRDKLGNVRRGKVWLFNASTKETRMADKGAASHLLDNGWVKCTKAMFRAANPCSGQLTL